jgi:hypothetical protein
MKRWVVLCLAVLVSMSLWPDGAQAATRIVRYGPFSVPAGTAEEPGMIHNQLRLGVARPCLDCFITSFTPDLVYGDGTRATMDTGAMLHHFVLTSQWRRDATCGGAWLGLAGERSSPPAMNARRSRSRRATGTASAGTTHGTCSST